MLQYYSKADYYLGEFKKQPNSVIEIEANSGKQNVVLKTADPGIVTETSMDDLVTWYNETIDTNPWPLAVAVEFVFRFLAIHPFQDGNGRLSRLLFQLALMTAKDTFYTIVIPYIALDRAIEQSRSKYYTVLRKCSNGVFQSDPGKYDYNHFLDYMIESLTTSLSNLDYYDQKYEKFISLSDNSAKVLKCFKGEPEHILKTKQLIEKTGIPRRTAIYSLNVLKDKGFIQQMGSGAGSRYKLVF